MAYVKGLAGGMLGLFVLATTFILIRALLYKGGPVGWDPISLTHSPVFWIAGLLFFVAGFYLALRLGQR